MDAVSSDPGVGELEVSKGCRESTEHTLVRTLGNCEQPEYYWPSVVQRRR